MFGMFPSLPVELSAVSRQPSAVSVDEEARSKEARSREEHQGHEKEKRTYKSPNGVNNVPLLK